MKKSLPFFFVLAFLSTGTQVFGQVPKELTRFMDNVVMIRGYSGDFGLILGNEDNKKNPYFLFVKSNPNFEQRLEVNYNNEKNYTGASLVTSDLRFGNYFLALYMIDGTRSVSKKYFKSTASDSYNSATVYYSFLSGAASQLQLAMNTRARYYRSADRSDLTKGPMQFNKGKVGQRVWNGMPVVDSLGNLSGMIAVDTKRADEKENQDYLFDVIDIKVIRNMLTELGRKAGNQCKYFNLVEVNSPNDETACEQTAREMRQEMNRLAQAEAKRIADLKQQAKKDIDDKVKAGGVSSLHPVERRIYRRNINRAIAIGPAAGAGIQFAPAGDGSLGTYYSLGANIYINPDKGQARLTLKPRMTQLALKTGTNYSYGTTKSGFALSKVSATIYELPAMLEVLIKRKENLNEYYGIGYGIGRVEKSEFEFNTTSSGARKQSIVGDPRYLHNLYLYTGIEAGRFRFDLGLSYQLQPVADKKYEMILGGESITPFKDLSKGSLGLGLEISIRLWNQWRNDYRTML